MDTNASMPLPDKLPSNSHNQYHKDAPVEKPATEEEPKPKKELSGNVASKPKSLGRRFLDTFFKDGASNAEIKTYLIEEVIVPAILENIADAINCAVEMRFFGTARRRKSVRGGTQNGSKVNYGNFFSGGVNERRERMARSTIERSARGSLDDYIFDNLRDAETILVDMQETLDKYKQVTVADYLDILSNYGISVKTEFTDNKFGWTDLSTVKPVRARGGGYYLDLPREEAL